MGVTRSDFTSTTYSNSSLPVLLDTGTTLSYLPSSIISKFARDFNATTHSDGTLEVDCSVASEYGTVDFKFDGETIQVPFQEFIVEVGRSCYVGALPSDAMLPVLGDSFLRSAYVIFDIDNSAIYLAQGADCGSNEQTLYGGVTLGGYSVGDCSNSIMSTSAASRDAHINVWKMWTWAALTIGISTLLITAV